MLQGICHLNTTMSEIFYIRKFKYSKVTCFNLVNRDTLLYGCINESFIDRVIGPLIVGPEGGPINEFSL